MFLLSSFLISQRIYNPQIIQPIRNFLGWEYINRLLPILIGLAFIISVVVCVILIIIGGIRWITSGGSKDTIASARNMITNAVTGLALLLSLYLLIQFVNYVFGINLGGFGTPIFTRIELRPPGQFANLERFEPNNLISSLIYIVIMVAALAFFFILVTGGVRWLTSGGDRAAIEAARRQIRNAIIGLVVVLSTFLIIEEVNCIFHINMGNLGVPPWCGRGQYQGSCINGTSNCICVCGAGEVPDPNQACTNNYPSCSGTCGCLSLPTPTFSPTPPAPGSCTSCSMLVQQNSGNNGFGASVMGQSFTEPSACSIDYVEVCLDNSQTTWGIQLRQGENINGTLLGTASVSDTGVSCVGVGSPTWFRGTFNPGVLLIASGIYTIRIDQSGTVHQAAGSNSNPYLGGRMYFSTNGWIDQNDLRFRVHGCPTASPTSIPTPTPPVSTTPTQGICPNQCIDANVCIGNGGFCVPLVCPIPYPNGCCCQY